MSIDLFLLFQLTFTLNLGKGSPTWHAIEDEILITQP